MVRLREWLMEAVDCVRWFFNELRRTDLGDEEHYPNGFRKFSCFDPGSYIVLALSLIALVLSLVSCFAPK